MASVTCNDHDVVWIVSPSVAGDEMSAPIALISSVSDGAGRLAPSVRANTPENRGPCWMAGSISITTLLVSLTRPAVQPVKLSPGAIAALKGGSGSFMLGQRRSTASVPVNGKSPAASGTRCSPLLTTVTWARTCLLYTSDAADDLTRV